MRKNIWIINEYAGSPDHGLHLRHYYLAKEFIKYGHNPIIISGSCSHLLHRRPETRGWFTKEKIRGINYIWIRVPQYKRSHSPKRMLKWLIFSSSLPFISKAPKPDIILASPTATYPIPPAYMLARKHKARFILEIRDIWPLTLKELGKLTTKHPLVVSMSWLEKWGIRKCDHLVSSLPGYGEYLKEMGMGRTFEYIPNGVDIQEMSDAAPLDPSIESQLPGQGFIVGYAGTFGCANALQYLLQAAEIITDSRVKFVLVGGGQEKNDLLKKYSSLHNVFFLPAIPKIQVQALLARFDVCYIGWNSSNIYRYGLAANKLFEYMYAAKPILHSCNSNTDVVKKAGCGLSVTVADPQAIAEGVMRMLKMPRMQREQMGKKGREYVIKNHAYESLALNYMNLFS